MTCVTPSSPIVQRASGGTCPQHASTRIPFPLAPSLPVRNPHLHVLGAKAEGHPWWSDLPRLAFSGQLYVLCPAHGSPWVPAAPKTSCPPHPDQGSPHEP